MGSHETSNDLTAGEINYANNLTLVVACRTDDRRPFGDKQIFLAMPDMVAIQRPANLVDGVTGYGYLGGAGVRGLGCPIDGPNGPGTGAGTGGFGVVGHGGTGDLNKNAANAAGIHTTFDPGAGVLGIGGFWTGGMSAEGEGGRRTRDSLGGAGVIGVAGGEHGPPGVPSFDQTAGMGVYGVSAVGGAGVVGVAGGGAMSPWLLELAKGVGVYGVSNVTGVYASSGGTAVKADGSNAGIDATSHFGPAGIFTSNYFEGAPVAQIRIQPLEMELTDAQVPFDPVVFDSGRDFKLPRSGKAGELLVTLKKAAPPFATLWFCEVSGGRGENLPNAIWREVLLGPEIKGREG